ncbi:GPI ethanolamine phosphate transferase 3 [Plasmodium gonderi]|uniref:GPI ethanolamine phosphate transferase 3 n=1 Tax=Plasmodium gonderi TaxID=77519 RepID=A0A1Y1JSX3_PLAGO|nr:GPI ethanolamine phosphate transferase 3 [Plasmodium gonderi]GAW83523.1 GPI ethanolamine phosphate transferase 3 [Plasmodium gonderi]
MKAKVKYNLFDNLLSNHVLIFFLIFLLNALIFFSFINGFLFPREGITNKSEDLETFSRNVFGDEYIESLKEKKNVHSIMNAPYDRIVILLIDALRFDFTLYDPNYKKEKEDDESIDEEKNTTNNVRFFQNNMMNLHNILKSEKEKTRLFRFQADAPTVTTSRLKSMVIGSIPNFLDINENFSPTDDIQDNFIEQLYYNRKTVTAIGDDTMVKLTKNVSRKLVYESFNIFDLYSLDIKSKNHFYEEYPLDYWDLLYVHVLGVDHVGHVGKPNSRKMKSVLKDFDIFINDIVEKVKSEEKKKTLFVLMGDHGQTQTGDHSGLSADETDTALFMYSPLTFMQLDKNINNNNFILYDKEWLDRNNSDSPYASSACIPEEDNACLIESYKNYHSALNNSNNDRTYFYNVRNTRQINLVSTLSFLIGSTIPFCNVGNVMMDLIPNAYGKVSNKSNGKTAEAQHNTNEKNENSENSENSENKINGNNISENDVENIKLNEIQDDSKHSDLYYELLNLHYIAELNYANLWQINRYLNEYEKHYSIVKNEDYFFIKNNWKNIEDEKEKFFQPYKKFMDIEEILTSEKEEYIKYINKMRNLMEITQKYFYFIFAVKKPSFILLCFIINIFFLIIFKIFYLNSKLNYYYKSISVGTFILFLTILFIMLIPLDIYNKSLNLLTFTFLFALLVVGHLFSRNKYTDFFRFIMYIKVFLIYSNLPDENLKKYTAIHPQHTESIYNEKNKNFNNKCQDKDTFFRKFCRFFKCLFVIIKRSITKSTNIVLPHVFNIIKFFFTKMKKLFKILVNNNYFLFVVIWSSFELSYYYVFNEKHYIHFILISYVFLSLFKNDSFFSLHLLRGMILLIVLVLNGALSYTPRYFEHDVEKFYLKKSILEMALPISCYLLSILLINCGLNKKLRRKIKLIMLVGWTLQFALVILYFLKVNEQVIFWNPPVIYLITFLLYFFVILSKSSIIKKEKVSESFQKIYEVSISLFLILFSSLQLSFIVYSNTNLSVVFFLYTTLIFFYFFFVSTNKSEGDIDMNNIKIKWIEENRHIDMFTQIDEEQECNTENNHHNHVNTWVKEKFDLKLVQQKCMLLDKCSILNEVDATQIQICKLVKSIPFFNINDTDFYLLSAILIKYSFFLTGHKFVLNSFPLTAAYIGFNKYVWPISQLYIFIHVFFPMLFSLIFILYVFNLRKIKLLTSFKQVDLYNFYFYPLINFCFKIIFIFCCKCLTSLWVAFYLETHLMLYDYFIPNYFFLTSINIVFITVSILILSLTKYIFLR